MRKFSVLFLAIMAAVFIFSSSAQAAFPNFGQDGLVTCSGAKFSEDGLDQCKSFRDILATAENIIEFILTIAIFIMAPIFLLIGGIMLMAGGANPGLHSKGVAYIKTTIIGLIIVLLAFALVNTFINALGIEDKIDGFGEPLNGNFKFIKTVYAEEISIDTSIPGTESAANPVEMIAGFYTFALAISGVLAVAVIIYGAIKYMASPGSASGQSDAKEWITSALLGILLLAGAYLVLNTINPELTILRLPGLQEIKVTTTTNPRPLDPGAGTGSYGFEGVAIPTGTYSDAEARAVLSAAGITVNKVNCTAPLGQNSCSREYSSCTDCTSLSGILKSAVSELVEFKQLCDQRMESGCTVRVTGGTEAGHSQNSRHRIGSDVIDISYRADVNGYIAGLIGEFRVEDVAPCTPHRGRDGNSYMLENSSCPWKPDPHWHIEF